MFLVSRPNQCAPIQSKQRKTDVFVMFLFGSTVSWNRAIFDQQWHTYWAMMDNILKIVRNYVHRLFNRLSESRDFFF